MNKWKAFIFIWYYWSIVVVVINQVVEENYIEGLLVILMSIVFVYLFYIATDIIHMIKSRIPNS